MAARTRWPLGLKITCTRSRALPARLALLNFRQKHPGGQSWRYPEACVGHRLQCSLSNNGRTMTRGTGSGVSEPGGHIGGTPLAPRRGVQARLTTAGSAPFRGARQYGADRRTVANHLNGCRESLPVTACRRAPPPGPLCPSPAADTLPFNPWPSPHRAPPLTRFTGRGTRVRLVSGGEAGSTQPTGQPNALPAHVSPRTRRLGRPEGRHILWTTS
jgi:hypothetical protein